MARAKTLARKSGSGSNLCAACKDSAAQASLVLVGLSACRLGLRHLVDGFLRSGWWWSWGLFGLLISASVSHWSLVAVAEGPGRFYLLRPGISSFSVSLISGSVFCATTWAANAAAAQQLPLLRKLSMS